MTDATYIHHRHKDSPLCCIDIILVVEPLLCLHLNPMIRDIVALRFEFFLRGVRELRYSLRYKEDPS